MPMLFCNVSWMERYAGRTERDPPLGGGGFPIAEGYCGEECNFVPGDDGYLYGHFETIKGEADRRVLIENLGASRSDLYVDGVDVVWTAPVGGRDPRAVVGWFRDARVYRERQRFNGVYPSSRHRRDEILSYRVRARVEDARLLRPGERTMLLGRGAGWSGQASWWYAEQTANPEARRFVRQVASTIASGRIGQTIAQRPTGGGRRAGAATSRAYSRYVSEHEVEVSPLHDRLQKRFVAYLNRAHEGVTLLDCHRDDLRYAIGGADPVMAEIKPADASSVRYAIRTAIGQLLDYRQHAGWRDRQIIVVGAAVLNADDMALALDNGFGLAWPEGRRGFVVKWPGGAKG